jgi:3-oxoacyl-[acyl-carrier protein] reductase
LRGRRRDGQDRRRADRQGGRAAQSFKGSVADPAIVKAMFDAAERAFGGIDVPVNNAGVMELALLAETEDAMFDRTVAINLKGVFNGLREAAQRLRDGGRVISLSTTVVGTYFAEYGAYAASKAGVEALTRVFAKEVGRRGITVNAVAPGPVETSLFTTGKTEAQLQAARERSPLGRLGQPGDVASVVSFLAGPDSGWVDGQVIRANGGAL